VFRCGSPDQSPVWRGFPIRTPWDHSPVIDSPRLIADSYVLLRLLMPRHPPCALKNLTTKDQKNHFTREPQKPHRTPTTPPKGHNRSTAQIQVHNSWKLLLIKDARVHYVVLKQQPHTPHPTHQPPTKPGTKTVRSAAPGNQKQTNPETLIPDPVASGPNSVPNTKPPLHPPAPFQDPLHKGSTSVLGAGKRTGGRYLLIFHP
jgi:hypothetical protein